MLALIAAATVAMAPPPAERMTMAELSEIPRALRLLPANPGVTLTLRDGRFCKGAGRFQTSLAEPALLFREQDRYAARLRKLIELPPAEACLLGDAPKTGGGER
jgi:hypothetical protein